LGGKGANLGAMLAAGLPVPSGFCVTTEAFAQFAFACPGLRPLLTALEAIGPQQSEETRAVSRQIREQFSAAPLPLAVEQAVVAAWRGQGTDKAYAVRSSATAEDQPGASFAGQGETFLNVRGHEAILRSVRECWISLFADRAVLYRIHNRIDHRTAAMAVVVQELINPDVSGVLFTADPVSGDRQRIIIEAAYGLGTALVSGEVGPDRLVLSRSDLKVLDCHVGRKTIEVVPDGNRRVLQRNVDSQRAMAACIDATVAARLGRLALETERLLGCPQDMEWAIAGQRIYLLQSRPITTLERKVGQPQSIWSNMNSWEVLPDVLTPMSWSVVNFQLHCLFDRLLEMLGVDVDRQPVFGLIAGRAYANLNTLAQIIRAVPGLELLDFVEGLGGQQGELLAGLLRQEPACDGWRRLRRAARFVRFAAWCVVHSVDQRSSRLLADFRRRVDELAGSDLATESEQGLLDRLGTLLNALKRVGPDATGSVSSASAMVRLFFNFVKGRAGSRGTAIANQMLGGLNGLASAEAGIALWRLAAWTSCRPPLRAIVAQSADFESLCKRMEEAAAGREFLARWDRFMLRHGHHAVGELDVHNPRWSETPALVLTMLRGYLDGLAGTDPQEFQRRLAGRRKALASDFRRQLGNPFQREIFAFLSRKAQGGIALRENMRNEVVRLLAAVRRILLELGARLVHRGILAERDDIFFVELSELRPLVGGVPLGGKIAARKAELEFHKSILPPPVVVGQFDPKKVLAGAIHGAGQVFYGLPASAGVATGPARVILHPQEGQQMAPGEILVAPFTDPGWTPYFLTAAGIVMDVGGMLSHGSIVAREYGIPAVVNVGSATRSIATGQIIRVDGERGVVTVLADGPTTPTTTRLCGG